MDRFAHYRGWSIDAAPIMAGKLFRASAIVERLIDGERFIFSDLGDRLTRDDAYLRAIEWTRHWIDNNYRNEPICGNGESRRAADPAS
ncbi:hypothetical protein [Paraburkholderia bannensis]|uniref:hypothetical protein n=1 Tax=Paraburkholderia bannensis TaxID=765414 RepID=UPI002AB72379|nr:hypothetical protein [Paraburkholderia bannensis]